MNKIKAYARKNKKVCSIMLRLAHNRSYVECIAATELKTLSVAVIRDALVIGTVLFIVNVILN